MSVLDLANEHMLARVPAPAKKLAVGIGNFKKPVVSESLAVHPDQIPEARETARKLGCAVPDFDSHGRPAFHSNLEMRRYAKAHGKRHRGYYG